MNAINLYLSTCRLVMQADVNNRDSYAELFRLLPFLRQSLSCTVCGKILSDPFTPTETSCQHHVCKMCIGGKKRLKPGCSWCKDYESYVENCQVRIIIQCYVKLCHFIKTSGLYRKIHMVITNGGHCSLSDLIDEVVTDCNLPESELLVQGSIKSSKLSASLPNIAIEAGTYDQTNCYDTFKEENNFEDDDTATEETNSLENYEEAFNECTPNNEEMILPPESPAYPQPVEKISPKLCISPPPLSPVAVASSSTTCTLSTTSVIPLIQPKSTSSIEFSTPSSLPYTRPISISNILPYSGISTMCNASVPQTSIATTQPIPYTQTVSSLISPCDNKVSYRVSLMPADSTSQSVTRGTSPDQLKFTPSDLYSHPILPPPVSRSLVDLSPTPLTPTASTAITCMLSIPPGTIFSNANAKNVRDSIIKHTTTLNNCSSVYSVMYKDSDSTKITIKRKPPDVENLDHLVADKKPIPIQDPLKKKKPKPKPKPKRKGCRCGNATPTPGKLTCCGQRCPCYVEAKACIECQCRGCRNPHRPGGKKVRPIIPQLGNIQIHQVKPVHPRVNPITCSHSINAVNPTLPSVLSHNSIMTSSVTVPQTIRAVQAMHAVQAVHGINQIHTVPGNVHQLINIKGMVDSNFTAGLNVHPVSDITLKPVNLALSSIPAIPAQLLINDDKSTSTSPSDNSDVDIDV